MNHQPDNTHGTRHRLLEAAADVFADKGFRDTTIREIVQRADANLNAVNYHFGDKESLYKAVVEYAHQCAGHKETFDCDDAHNLTAEEQLRIFVRQHLIRMLSQGRPTWLEKLRMHELIEPTGILDTFILEHVRPHHEALCRIIRKLVGNEISDEQVGMCAVSIVGQCLHYQHGRTIITRLRPEIKYDEQGLETIADHITRFSIAAMKNMTDAKGDRV